jgi:hypothetical protein
MASQRSGLENDSKWFGACAAIDGALVGAITLTSLRGDLKRCSGWLLPDRCARLPEQPSPVRPDPFLSRQRDRFALCPAHYDKWSNDKKARVLRELEATMAEPKEIADHEDLNIFL